MLLSEWSFLRVKPLLPCPRLVSGPLLQLRAFQSAKRNARPASARPGLPPMKLRKLPDMRSPRSSLRSDRKSKQASGHYFLGEGEHWGGEPWSVYINPSSIRAIESSQLPISRVKVPPKSTPLVIVLVSKGLAALANESSPFLSNLIPQVLSDPEPGQDIDTLVAVVDRISCPRFDAKSKIRLRYWDKNFGYEGISVWAVDSQHSIPNRWFEKEATEPLVSPGAQEPGFIEFETGLAEEPLPIHRTHIHYAHTLRLGLATTLFENGQPSTCILQRWVVRDGGADRLFRLSCKIQRHLQACTVRLPSIPKQLDTDFKLPRCEVLTSPKIISESKGNIIRTLQTSRTPNDVEPASSALEQAISLISSPGSSIGPYTIWAKVVKRELWPGAALDFAIKSPMRSSSARYIKVISGGGGYGSRHGLLSLDPELVFSNAADVPADSFAGLEDDDSEDLQAFKSVVSPGDVVQFIAFFDQDTRERRSLDNLISYDYGLHGNKGTCQVDAGTTLGFGGFQFAPTCKITEETTNGLDCVIVNHFGALSESGFWVQQRVVGEPGQTVAGALLLGVWTESKMPPFTRFDYGVQRSLGSGGLRHFEWPNSGLQRPTPIIQGFRAGLERQLEGEE